MSFLHRAVGAAAREKALLSRRKKLKDKLESKLAELRHVLGCDLRSDTVEKFATAMMKQEETLRGKQSHLTERLIDTIESFKADINALKDMQMLKQGGASTTQAALGRVIPPKNSAVSKRPASNATSSASGRTLSLVY